MLAMVKILLYFHRVSLAPNRSWKPSEEKGYQRRSGRAQRNPTNQTEETVMKKIPYGISNFKDLILEEYLYIDKTDYIATLEEEGKFNILLRPRRFGKSLFLSSLLYYYDVAAANDFDAIFGSLAIGRHPTPAKNRYQMLVMDFSGFEVDSTEAIREGFTLEVKTELTDFLSRYDYPAETINRVDDQASPAGAMKVFFKIVREQKIYLLIDEYDHFANAIMGEDLTLFKQVVGKGGFVRAFYETIKTATRQGIVDRLFITGVTSITLDSLTSGFNITNNLTHQAAFNQAIGFTRDELKTVVRPLVDACDLDRDTLLNELAKWYNGYCFNIRAKELMFNSDMVLYFVKHFDIRNCEYPEQMLDENIASDYGKIMKLFAIGDSERNYKVLEELITNGEVIGGHSRKIDMDKGFDRDDFISLLLYMGFITISGRVLTRLRYTIPNYVIQRLYFAYFKVELERRSRFTISGQAMEDAIIAMALHNNLTPFTEEISKVLTLFSNRDYMNMDEKHIKAVILTLLYQSPVYFIKSEPEINNRYPDILLLERSPFEVKHQFLFELKYSKKSEGAKGWQEKREEGIQQVQEYLQLEDIRELPKLRAYLLLTNGTEVELISV